MAWMLKRMVHKVSNVQLRYQLSWQEIELMNIEVGEYPILL